MCLGRFESQKAGGGDVPFVPPHDLAMCACFHGVLHFYILCDPWKHHSILHLDQWLHAFLLLLLDDDEALDAFAAASMRE